MEIPPRLRIGVSHISSDGVFAVSLLIDGECLGRFAEGIEAFHLNPEVKDVFHYGMTFAHDKKFVDGLDDFGNVCHWTAKINHSFEPNVLVDSHGMLFVIREIKPGQEVLINYGLNYWKSCIPIFKTCFDEEIRVVLDCHLTTALLLCYKEQLAKDALRIHTFVNMSQHSFKHLKNFLRRASEDDLKRMWPDHEARVLEEQRSRRTMTTLQRVERAEMLRQTKVEHKQESKPANKRKNKKKEVGPELFFGMERSEVTSSLESCSKKLKHMKDNFAKNVLMPFVTEVEGEIEGFVLPERGWKTADLAHERRYTEFLILAAAISFFPAGTWLRMRGVLALFPFGGSCTKGRMCINECKRVWRKPNGCVFNFVSGTLLVARDADNALIYSRVS